MACDRPQVSIRSDIRQGLQISVFSLGWTVAAGLAAIAIGVIGNNLTLTVLGIVGMFDAAGSGTLAVSFRDALHKEAISPRRERVALLVIGCGMAIVGAATIADSAYRLINQVKSTPLLAGIILAAASIAVLSALAVRKRQIARRILSDALHADGWLSAAGALLAGVALVGTLVDRAFGWWWLDPVGAILVASGAIGLSFMLTRH